jgi:hypothetical protein
MRRKKDESSIARGKTQVLKNRTSAFGKGLATSIDIAGIRTLARMNTAMHGQIASLTECLAASFELKAEPQKGDVIFDFSNRFKKFKIQRAALTYIAKVRTIARVDANVFLQIIRARGGVSALAVLAHVQLRLGGKRAFLGRRVLRIYFGNNRGRSGHGSSCGCGCGSYDSC